MYDLHRSEEDALLTTNAACTLQQAEDPREEFFPSVYRASGAVTIL